MTELFTPGAFEDSGGGPLYLQLQRLIAGAIASGQLKPGASLPSERELAAMTGLSRVTVRIMSPPPRKGRWRAQKQTAEQVGKVSS